MAKRLHRANPVTGKRRSLRKIAAELAAVGHLNSAKYGGSDVPRPFNPGTIKAMVEGPAPARTGARPKIKPPPPGAVQGALRSDLKQHSSSTAYA
jgi:hypothetical protein